MADQPQIQSHSIETKRHLNQKGGICSVIWEMPGNDVFHWHCRQEGMMRVTLGHSGPFEGYVQWDAANDGPPGLASTNPGWLRDNGYRIYEDLWDLPNPDLAQNRYAAAHLHYLTALLDEQRECLVPLQA